MFYRLKSNPGEDARALGRLGSRSIQLVVSSGCFAEFCSGRSCAELVRTLCGGLCGICPGLAGNGDDALSRQDRRDVAGRGICAAGSGVRIRPDSARCDCPGYQWSIVCGRGGVLSVYGYLGRAIAEGPEKCPVAFADFLGGGAGSGWPATAVALALGVGGDIAERLGSGGTGGLLCFDGDVLGQDGACGTRPAAGLNLSSRSVPGFIDGIVPGGTD